MKRPLLRFPWVTAAIGALLVAAGGLSLFRLPSPPEPGEWVNRGGTSVPLTLAGPARPLNEPLREELALRDPTPLFLPTRWNSGQAPLIGDRMEPGTTFGDFEPKLAFSEADVAIVLPPVADVPADALAAVTALPEAPAIRELTRVDLPLEALPERLAHLRVTEAADGEERLAENLTTLPESEATLLRQEVWAPMELLVAISPGGMIGRPALVLASGSEAVDTWALNYLAGMARLGARLEPGFYRVLIGP